MHTSNIVFYGNNPETSWTSHKVLDNNDISVINKQETSDTVCSVRVYYTSKISIFHFSDCFSNMYSLTLSERHEKFACTAWALENEAGKRSLITIVSTTYFINFVKTRVKNLGSNCAFIHCYGATQVRQKLPNVHPPTLSLQESW